MISRFSDYRISVMFLFLCLVLNGYAKKIVVVTDMHVMAPELLVEDGTAWQNYLDNDRKMVDHSVELFDIMINRIKNDIHPDLVFLTGDLSKDGEVASHRYIVSKLDELRRSGIEVLVVPGNHDMGTSNAKYYNGVTSSDAEVATVSSFPVLYANYGYNSGTRDPNSLSYVYEPFEGLCVLAIDSHTGSVGANTLDWLCEKAELACSTGKQVVAMMHHPLMPHFNNVESFVSDAVLADYENVRNRLADAGVDVVFTGHFHCSDIAKDYNADLSRSIIDINTGSLISYPSHYRVLDFAEDLSEFSVSTMSIDNLVDGDGFKAYSKERYRASLEKYANSIPTYALASSYIADAFVCHAEGNEHQSSSAQATLSSLMSFAAIARTLGTISEDKIKNMEDLANSMLKDISNFGVSGRANQTDDLSLVVPMSDMSVSFSIGESGWATFCCDKRVDFSAFPDVKAFIVSDVTSKDVVLQQVTVIPPSTGIVLQGTASRSYNTRPTTKACSSVGGNKLKGTDKSVVAESGMFVLARKNGLVGFYAASPGLEIPKGKAFLPSSSTVSLAKKKVFGLGNGIFN